MPPPAQPPVKELDEDPPSPTSSVGAEYELPVPEAEEDQEGAEGGGGGEEGEGGMEEEEDQEDEFEEEEDGGGGDDDDEEEFTMDGEPDDDEVRRSCFLGGQKCVSVCACPSLRVCAEEPGCVGR